MNLYRLLCERRENPVRVGIIGAGKFASMFLAQARHTPGLHVTGVCDLDLRCARKALQRTGWSPAEINAKTVRDAIVTGTTYLTGDAVSLISTDGLDVIIDATGDPVVGIRHALACIEARRHIIMVNVEADVLAGPLLAQRAREAGIVYSMAYGDQPALIVELVDWARAAGLDVVCAGKGTKYMPEYHASTPDTVWQHYGLTPERAAQGGMNPKMFNSFLDGTKSAIEMAAVANATGLTPPSQGLQFPPCGVDTLPQVLKPRSRGGVLQQKGMVEVISSQNRDSSRVERDLRWGVYVTFEAPSDYTAQCFGEYGLVTDDSGRYSALYRPFHLIGLELGISVALAALRGEATGAAQSFAGDVVATAKRDLRAGELLDGEGGYCVWGRLMPAADSLTLEGLPIGLAHNVKLKTAVGANQPVRWRDVDIDETLQAVRIRREMEAAFRQASTTRATA
jgi:predicted homoserine dehydrogenase-like protein